MNILKNIRDSSKIFLAQTALHLEGIHLDSVDTLELINSDNKKVFEVDEEDAIIMRNVVNTLDYLKTIDFDNTDINLDLYIKLNSILAKDQALFVGKLRDTPTFIGCIDEEIGVYDKKFIINEVAKLNSINNDNFRKIIPEVFCRLSRMQPFYDGNKRSTNFLCNIALIKKNIGLFFIDYDNLKDFNINLKDYYQNQNNNILEFIGNKLIRTANELEKEELVNSKICEVDQKNSKTSMQGN
ncbi:MAG: Fic family protein [Lachnospiraceae bacterium]|nr:Fic family protein [Lachnospiraceae bacterium]